MAYIELPKEVIRSPRSIAKQMFDIRRWTQAERVGHFAALEQPKALVDDMRQFFCGL